MSFHYQANLTPATGALAMFALKQALAAAGWTFGEGTSDGTTYSATQDQITGGGAGAGGLDNPSAWFVAVQPGAVGGLRRRICVQRDAADHRKWRIKYVLAALSAGAPGATQTPTAANAADEHVVLGGGTDAAPTMTTLFPADTTYRLHAAADDVIPFAFYCVTYPTGGGNPSAALMLDGLLGGSAPAEDLDPYAVLVRATGNALASNSMSRYGQSGCSAYSGKFSTTPAIGAWGETPICLICQYAPGGALSQLAPGDVPANPCNGKDDLPPVLYSRSTTIAAGGSTPGWKGWSGLMRCQGGNRTTGDTESVASTADRIVLGDVSLPWNGSAPLV